jgi:glycerol-3-phosphate acyltransferase PlsY
MSELETAAALLGAYLVGGVPFSLVLGFLIRRIDIRKHGSANVGATNLGRVCGWHYFPIAFLLDFAKGLGPVVLLAPPLPAGDDVGPGPVLIRVGLALAPVLGHCFSPYLLFRGGKGVATSAGAMAALMPWATGIAFLVWLLSLAVTRTVGVASSCAALALPIVFFLLPHQTRTETLLLGLLSVLLAALVLYRHRENLRDYIGRP